MNKPFALAFRLLSRASAGARVALPVVLATTCVVACADENDPKTWVKRLDDPAQRSPAIKRLGQFFNDAMAKSDNKRDDPKVKALLDVAVEPLTKTYTAGGLDDKTREDLIKILADMGDVRAAPAFAKAFKDFEPGKNGDDVKYAAQGTSRLAEAGKLGNQQPLVDALWDCFARTQPSKLKSINLVKDLQGAVMKVKSPTYGPKAVAKLKAPVTDPKKRDQALDQLQFWQGTSTRLIGELKYTPGVKPLVNVLLTPTKGALIFPVRNALTKMPKESEPVLIAALKGSDPALTKLTSVFPEKAYVPRVAEPLAYISRPAGRDAIVDALAAADNDQNRTMLAVYLTYFPSDKKTVKAYLDAYEKIPSDAAIAQMGGGNGRAILAQATANFFDSSLTDWLLKETASATGDAADAMPPAAYPTAIKLMTPKQSKAVGEAVGKIPGKAIEKEMYKSASAVVDKCNEDVSCYLGVLDTQVPSNPPAAKMGHVKAAWMVGMFGKDDARPKLVEKIAKVKDGSVRLAMAEALDHLAPKGDDKSAEALEKIVQDDRAAGIKAATDELYRIALKLRSRTP